MRPTSWPTACDHHQRRQGLLGPRRRSITSKDTNLTKSHGRYLESRLISLATQAGRVTLENGTAPPVPALPEADASDMDYFLSQLQIVLPVLGVNAIRVRPSKPAAGDTVAGAPSRPSSGFGTSKLGVDAQAQQIDGEFTMLAGSGRRRVVARRWQGRQHREGRTRPTAPSTSSLVS
ncbi:MAG: hypothetical protein WKF76_09550 [Nocardioidaceae bacterium]